MSNEYKKKAKKKSLLGELSSEAKKEQFNKTMEHPSTSTLVDAAAAIGGGFAGTAIGRPSFFAGAAISGLSHFFKKHIGVAWSRIGSVFGVGVMAGGITKGNDNSTNGLGENKQGHVEAAKARMKNYSDDLKTRLYLDKIFGSKKKETTQEDKKGSTTNTTSSKEEENKTVGETTTFVYPETEPRKKAQDVDLSKLDEFEEGLHRTAEEQQRKTEGTNGLDEEVSGTGELDPEEKNY